MRKKSSILLPLMIIPVVALIVGLGLFTWLSLQVGEPEEFAQDALVAQTDRRGGSVAGGRNDVVSPAGTLASADRGENQNRSTGSDTSASADVAGSIRDAANDPLNDSLDSDPEYQAIAVDGEAIVVLGDGRSDAGDLSDSDSVTENERLDRDNADNQNSESEANADDARDDEEENEEANDDSEPIENSGNEVLAGRVIDRGGFPVSGLSVVATNRDEGQNYSGTVTSDSDGRFELNNIRVGEYLLKTVATRDYPSASLYARSGNKAATLTVSRLNQITVHGLVKDDAGQLLTGVSVQTPDGSASTQSNEAGQYRIDLVSSQNQGFVIGFSEDRHIEDFLHISSGAIKATRPGEPVRADMVLRRTGRLSVAGEVLDPQYVPIENALVQVTSRQRDFHQSIQSDDNGRFRIDGLLEASDYTIKVSSTSDYGIWLRENVEIVQPLEYSVTLAESSSGRMAGSIVDRNQIPLPKLSLLAMRGGSDGRVVSVESDDNGFFEINDFVASKLSFVSRSTPSIKIEGASIAAGDDVQVTLVVNIGSNELSGTLISEGTRTPISRANLTMTWQESFGNLRSRVSHSTTSDDNGVFLFSELGDGEWTLGINADGHKTVTQVIKPASQPDGLVVPLKRG